MALEQLIILTALGVYALIRWLARRHFGTHATGQPAPYDMRSEPSEALPVPAPAPAAWPAHKPRPEERQHQPRRPLTPQDLEILWAPRGEARTPYVSRAPHVQASRVQAPRVQAPRVQAAPPGSWAFPQDLRGSRPRLGSPADLRRAIVLMTILGPPRVLDSWGSNALADKR
jgi:hypothetical protein